ncbi:MAG: DUF192 domain-containing protein [Tumebacillaceae bacterium]
MEVWNESKGVRLAWQAQVAETFWTKLRGWTGKKTYPVGEALVIRSCKGVHTFFMKEPVDMVILDREQRIVQMLHSVTPYKMVPLGGVATHVVEFPAGTLSATGTQCHDTLAFGSMR